jgi:hypothetical protein
MSAASGYMADPPPGVERMPDNPPTLVPNMYASGITTTLIAFIMVVLRIHTRWHLLGRRIKADDYLVMAAMVFSLILLAMGIKQAEAGIGKHMWDVRVEVYAWLPLYTILATNSYSISICLSKLSILVFYLQLSPCQWFRTLVWALVTSVIVYTITYVFMTIFTCTPIAAAWDLTLTPTAKCLPLLTRYMVLSILNICIDVSTLVLPLTVVLPLQMTVRRKVSLLFLFTTGLLCVSSSRPARVGLPADLSQRVRCRDPSYHHPSAPPQVGRLQLGPRRAVPLVLHGGQRWHHLRLGARAQGVCVAVHAEAGRVVELGARRTPWRQRF